MTGFESFTSVALLGMPSTGKTTFLAAMYHALCAAPPGSTPSLARLPEQRAYLQEIREAWLAGRTVNRNRIETGELVELEIDTEAGRIALRIPDIAGESFENLVAERQAHEILRDYLRDADGLMLFMHPDEVSPRVSVAEANRMRALVGDNEPSASDVRTFDPRLLPAEVRLVDLLQWVVDVRNARPTRLALMISAWDQIPDISPGSWLKRAMPMLHQFLATNVETLTCQIVGVSAQGGDYDSDPQLAAKPPAQRPFLVRSDGTRTSDLFESMIWTADG